MRIISVKMPETYLDWLDMLVKSGKYSNRSEAIRAAVRELIRRELFGNEEHINSSTIIEGEMGT